MNERAKRISRLVSALITGGLVLATLVVFRSVPARAWGGGETVPSPCDFTTGGGWIRIAAGAASNNGGLPGADPKAEFGLGGGRQKGGVFGPSQYMGPKKQAYDCHHMHHRARD